MYVKLLLTEASLQFSICEIPNPTLWIEQQFKCHTVHTVMCVNQPRGSVASPECHSFLTSAQTTCHLNSTYNEEGKETSLGALLKVCPQKKKKQTQRMFN